MADTPPAPPAPEITADERAELDARLARMVGNVSRADLGGGRYLLLWTEKHDDDKPQIMRWFPETPVELRQAAFFYDAVFGLGYFARPVLPGEPVRRDATEVALIRAILADRDDATGYLVYADYLTEAGSSHGDYIRRCVERSFANPEAGDDTSRAHWDGSVFEDAEEWFAPLRALGLNPTLRDGAFLPFIWLSPRTGVIDRVVIDRPGLLPGAADRLFAAAPFLRMLTFVRGHLDAGGLAGVPQLAQIEVLRLPHTGLTAPDLEALLRSDYLCGLKALDLAGNEIGDAGAVALAAWPGLRRLEALGLTGCDIGPGGAAALEAAGATRMKQVRVETGPANLDDQTQVLAARLARSLRDGTGAAPEAT